jgi:ABC-type multidrug transport system fused ATPase/permease subunit
VKQAAHAMGMDHHFEKFPQGYETVLAEEGLNLSFGERQLLSFSRALTFDPEILIMDEATSSVDPLTEQEIQESLEKLLEGRTSVVIAHRLSTIRNADKILVIDNGNLVEMGNHNELLKLNGVYANLYNTQMGKKDVA